MEIKECLNQCLNQDSILANMLFMNVVHTWEEITKYIFSWAKQDLAYNSRGESKHVREQIQLNCSLDTKVKVCPL